MQWCGKNIAGFLALQFAAEARFPDAQPAFEDD
jgi:hypothetical protein